jgi:hypothetical protein
MRKLRLHHKGERMLYALQQGCVMVTPSAIYVLDLSGKLGNDRPNDICERPYSQR